MTENKKENKLRKAKWSKPELLILNFRKTEGGYNPTNKEDTQSELNTQPS
jgi:hypothetical protein